MLDIRSRRMPYLSQAPQGCRLSQGMHSIAVRPGVPYYFLDFGAQPPLAELSTVLVKELQSSG